MASENIKKYAVIVAGGSGRRMKSVQPKQFVPLGNKVILMHTITKFKEADPTISIVLVLPNDHIITWGKLIQEYNFDIPHEIKPGGKTRFQSVKSGIENLEPNSIVAIHDGVRPFVSKETILTSFDQATEIGNAIAAVPLKDSIREVTQSKNVARDRSKFRLIQTPQTFKTNLLQNAYKTEEKAFFTDDASVMEHNGFDIHLIDGSYQNIKITTPEDLLFAGVLLGRES